MSTLRLSGGSAPSYPVLPEHTVTGPHAHRENPVQKWLGGMVQTVRGWFAATLDAAPYAAPKTSVQNSRRLSFQQLNQSAGYGGEWKNVK